GRHPFVLILRLSKDRGITRLPAKFTPAPPSGTSPPPAALPAPPAQAPTRPPAAVPHSTRCAPPVHRVQEGRTPAPRAAALQRPSPRGWQAPLPKSGAS